MSATIVGEFKSGDKVPDWLLEILPLNADSVLGQITFATNSIIIEAFNGYHIIPEIKGIPCINVNNSNHLSIGALEVSVFIPTNWQVLYIKEES